MRRYLATCSSIALILVLLLAVYAAATDHRFIESFNTKQYCDTVNTTALWDTVAGDLKLYPCEFAIVGEYDTYGTANGVAIDGDYAYVADGASGLVIVDIANPESPVLLGTYDTPGTAYDVFADGNHIYVADGSSGIIVLDVTNPASPALLGSYNTSGSAYAVVVEGDYAYVADNTSGLVVLNVTNPASPMLVGSYNTPGNARGIAVAGNLAFVADGVLGGLQIIGISTPAAPTLVGSCDTPGSAQDVDVTGDFAYVADYSYGLRVIDISSPASPALAGGVTLSGMSMGVDVGGDFAYVSDYAAGLAEIDISNPTAPVPTRSIATPDNAWDVAIAGNHAFVATEASGLQIVRIGAPMPPRMEGLCSAGAKPSDVTIDGDYAYVAAGTSGLQVVDISDPSAPVSVGSYATPDSCCFVAVDGDYAFASVSGAGVIVLSIVNPSSPVLLGSCDTPGYSNHVAVAGNYAFVVDGSHGLQVINIADPANPVIAGHCSGPAWGGIAIAGDYALITAGTFGVSSFDISNPASPVLARTLYTGGWADDIAVAGDYAFVASSDVFPSLQVIDISDPANIAIAWTQALPSPAMGVALAGDHAFVGETASGFRTCRIAQSNFLILEKYGQSSVLDFVNEPIVKVRLSTAQADSIKWFVSAMGGVSYSWQTVPPDWTWQTITYPGTEVLWYSLHVLLDYTINPACSELMLEWLYEGAVVDSIRDIPGDQGGQVRVHFARSGYDFSDEATHPISMYYVWRRMDDPVALQAFAREVEPASVSGTAATSEPGEQFDADAPSDLPVIEWNGRLILDADRAALSQDFPPGVWEIVGSAPGAQKDQYIDVVPTLADSTVEDGMAYAVYLVTAHTTTPSVWYASAPDSGYSLDNLAPHVPTGFAVAYNSSGGNELSWDASPDYDFEYFKVYRGTSEDFEPAPENLVQATIDTGWLDTVENGYLYLYKITAVDHAGNESGPASAGTVTGTEPPAAPREFALYQNVPNPFNPTTRIRFDLPEAADMRLVIYNVSGQKIRVLADAQMAAGAREMVWDGRDDVGRAAASGIYFYRLDAGRFTQTRKMILLR